jgi:SpoVK/Ycf46/Vps4 family AAA+-type ATPase
VRLDPDAPQIAERQARSAILFGPPGTSKTTLVEALAGAINWDFVEVLPSQFLADGLNNVAARADAIFDQLMELDRCVILFDEIDEVIRNRSERDSDPFGRFLTTTMLPKLARLWAQRRVLFFVNTNWITKADPAIRRSQRFDAVLFVAPPSLRAKQRTLKGCLAEDARSALAPKIIREALGNNTDDTNPLGWIALLGYDQLQELRLRLERTGSPASLAALKDSLSAMAPRLESSDWHQVGDDNQPIKPFALFVEMAKQETVDLRSVCLARLIAKESVTYVAIDAGEPPPPRLASSHLEFDRGPLLQYKSDGKGS